MGRKVKYMGDVHERGLLAGEDFGGRLGTPLSKDVVWNFDNNHVVDSEEAGLSDAALSLLLSYPEEFLDVTDMEIVPVGAAAKRWRAVQDSQSNTPDVVQPTPIEPQADESPRYGTSSTTTSFNPDPAD